MTDRIQAHDPPPAPATGMQLFDIGHVDDFRLDGGTIVEVGGRSVAVFRSNGTFWAVQNLCPHALAPIGLGVLSGTFLPTKPGEDPVYGMDGLVLRCIWHGWEFDVRTGETVCGVDRRRLATFAVTVEDDRVRVLLRPRRETLSRT